MKRAREKARQDKQEAKREKRASARENRPPPGNEDALMEEFARISARRELGEITESDYEAERHRIFVALGVESDTT